MADNEDFDLDYRRSTVAKIHESFRSLGDGLSSLRKYLFIGIGAIVVFCAVIFGLTVASYEYTKEFSPSTGSVMTDVHTGDAVATMGFAEETNSFDDLYSAQDLWFSTKGRNSKFTILGVEDHESGNKVVYTANGQYIVGKDIGVRRLTESNPGADDESSADEESSRHLLGGGSTFVCYIFPSLCATGTFGGRHLVSVTDALENYSSWGSVCTAWRTEMSYQDADMLYASDSYSSSREVTDKHCYVKACSSAVRADIAVDGSGRHRSLTGSFGPWWMCLVTGTCGTGTFGGRHLAERELEGGSFSRYVCFLFPYLCGTGTFGGRHLAGGAGSGSGSSGIDLANSLDSSAGSKSDYIQIATADPFDREFCCVMCGFAGSSMTNNFPEIYPKKSFSSEGTNGYKLTVSDILKGDKIDDYFYSKNPSNIDLQNSQWHTAVFDAQIYRGLPYVGSMGSTQHNRYFYNPCKFACAMTREPSGLGSEVCESSGVVSGQRIFAK